MKDIPYSIEFSLDWLILNILQEPNQKNFDIAYDTLGNLHQAGYDIDRYVKIIEAYEVQFYGKPKES